jgi:hypothetical protein
MSRFLLALGLAAGFLVEPALGQSRLQNPDSSRDLATLIAHAEVAAARAESPEERQLRVELVAVQQLFVKALLDAAQDTDSGALQILGAECARLLPRVPAPAPGAALPSLRGWQLIGHALATLCQKRAELSESTDPNAKRAVAEALLERVRRVSDPTRGRVPPTVRLPKASELRPSRR